MIGSWPMSEPFPAVLGDRELMRVLGVGKSLFYRLKAARTFAGLECRPQLTNATRYSGILVQRWAEGGGQWAVKRGKAA